MKRYFPVMVLLALAAWGAGVIIAGGSLGPFFDPPSLALVLLPPFLLSLGVFGLRGIGSAFAVGFRGEGAPEAELRKGLAFFEALQWYLILSGFLGTVLGIICILMHVDDKNALGKGMALAFLTLWYALLLVLVVVVPFRSGIRRRLAEAGKAS